ncbi:MAG: 50S ribosomal protein L17 [Planctomycetota bacterium]
MRHRVQGRKFGRKTEHRIALKRNLLKALFTHGRVVTTLPKAKEYRPHAERMITLAKQRTLPNIRRAAALLGNDRVVVKKLFDEIAPRFADRNGGYTRILKLAHPRLGDNAPRAIFELVGHSEAISAQKAAEEGKKKKKKGAKGKAETKSKEEG